MDYKQIFIDELDSIQAKYDGAKEQERLRELKREAIEKDLDKLLKEYASIQFDKVVEKHLKKMALHVERDNYGII